MTNEIKTTLTKQYPLEFKASHVAEIKKIVKAFELSPIRAEALNAATLGVYKARFYVSDKDKLFHLFKITSDEFLETLKGISSIDLSRGVSGNPFNIFTVWCAHRLQISSLSKKDKEEGTIELYKYMNYSFFTSTVSFSLFKDGVNEELMQYTVETLSDKSDIKISGSWKNEIAELVSQTRKRGSHWHKYESSFAPDIEALRLIIYQQNNLRRKMIRLANVYYDNFKRGIDIKSNSKVLQQGAKLSVKDVEAVIPEMVNSVVNRVTNPTTFIDLHYVEAMVKLYKGVNGSNFITLLKKFSEEASQQKRDGKESLTTGKGNRKELIGYKILLATLIQTAYREAIVDPKCNMSRVSIVMKTQSIFTVSRISKEEILVVKHSLAEKLKVLLKTKREATITAYRMAFITYIIFQTFND